MIVFIGEDRSELVKRRRWRMEDGRLAGKQLFDALAACGVTPGACQFFNLFERGGWRRVMSALEEGLPLIAMGKRVQRAFEEREVPHVSMVHPAARGAIRRKDRYAAEVFRTLVAVGFVPGNN